MHCPFIFIWPVAETAAPNNAHLGAMTCVAAVGNILNSTASVPSSLCCHIWRMLWANFVGFHPPSHRKNKQAVLCDRRLVGILGDIARTCCFIPTRGRPVSGGDVCCPVSWRVLWINFFGWRYTTCLRVADQRWHLGVVLVRALSVRTFQFLIIIIAVWHG